MSEYCINCEATAGELAATHLVLASKNETIDGLTAALATARAALRIHADLNGELSAALQSAQVERDNARSRAIKDCAAECKNTYEHLWAKSREQSDEAQEVDYQAKATGALQCFHTLCEMAAKEGKS